MSSCSLAPPSLRKSARADQSGPLHSVRRAFCCPGFTAWRGDHVFAVSMDFLSVDSRGSFPAVSRGGDRWVTDEDGFCKPIASSAAEIERVYKFAGSLFDRIIAQGWYHRALGNAQDRPKKMPLDDDEDHSKPAVTCSPFTSHSRRRAPAKAPTAAQIDAMESSKPMALQA